MFKGDRSSGELNGFLDAGSNIQGDLVFDDTFRVDGKLTGTVRSKGDLVVGEQGLVEAEVQVGRLFVSGTLRGTVIATRRVELASSARVEASLESPTLVIEEGAKMDGRCVTGGGPGPLQPDKQGKVDSASKPRSRTGLQAKEPQPEPPISTSAKAKPKPAIDPSAVKGKP